MNLERIVGNVLSDALAKQPWWKRYAGTVTMAVSVLVTLGTWILTTYAASLPETASIAIGGIVAVLSVIAARAVPNGITPRGNEQIKQAVGSELQHYTVQARQTAAEVVDPIAEAVARGWSEHDPRYIGMTAVDAARSFLAGRTA